VSPSPNAVAGWSPPASVTLVTGAVDSPTLTGRQAAGITDSSDSTVYVCVTVAVGPGGEDSRPE
jgi:hypothetical protein